MLDPFLLAGLAIATLLGGALLRAARLERRRARFEPRLKGLAGSASSTDGLVALLRRPLPGPTAMPAAVASRLAFALAGTGHRIRPLHLAAAAAAAALAAILLATGAELGAVPTVVLGLVGGVAAPAMLVQMAQSRYQRQFLEVFPDALDLIARAVRAGLPAPEAIELASREARPPVRAEFMRMLDEMRIGSDVEETLRRAAERIRVPDFQFFVVSLLLQRQTGGGIAETLANLSTIIRQRKALRQKARALSAEAQASAAIVATTPFIAGGGLFLINRELMSVLFTDPRGRFMLSVAVASLLSGIVVMRALIRKNLR
jgi:Flp pilus assembly protein TadB